jgi:hypothetical protein
MCSDLTQGGALGFDHDVADGSDDSVVVYAGKLGGAGGFDFAATSGRDGDAVQLSRSMGEVLCSAAGRISANDLHDA